MPLTSLEREGEHIPRSLLVFADNCHLDLLSISAHLLYTYRHPSMLLESHYAVESTYSLTLIFELVYSIETVCFSQYVCMTDLLYCSLYEMGKSPSTLVCELSSTNHSKIQSRIRQVGLRMLLRGPFPQHSPSHQFYYSSGGNQKQVEPKKRLISDLKRRMDLDYFPRLPFEVSTYSTQANVAVPRSAIIIPSPPNTTFSALPSHSSMRSLAYYCS